MVRRPKVFIIFSFEKERSALARDWQYSDIAVIELKRATNIERSGGRGGWVAVGLESPSGGCNLSSKLSCGVEKLKSSVDIVAKTCAYDDDDNDNHE